MPKGNYVLIKGDPGDPNASTFLPAGWDQAGLKDKVASGDIKILADQSTDAWKTDVAQNNMEAIIDKANTDGNKIDAVLAENDSTALGVVAALTAKNYGVVPVSGQDGDPANLNNVAKGLQYVDVWKDSTNLGKVAGAAALQLCAGAAMGAITTPADLDSGCRSGRRQHGCGLHDPRRDRGQVAHPDAAAHHRRQPPARAGCRLDHQGRPVQGRRRGDGSGRLQVTLTLAS